MVSKYLKFLEELLTLYYRKLNREHYLIESLYSLGGITDHIRKRQLNKIYIKIAFCSSVGNKIVKIRIKLQSLLLGSKVKGYKV